VQEPRASAADPGDLDGETVYDASGSERSCQPPERDCPPIAPDRPFMDGCQLAGYRVVRCGCDSLCTGQVTEHNVFDAEGNAKPCAELDEDCAPPPASAAFQDRCIERGHHLQQCGCEWVCSGDPT